MRADSVAFSDEGESCVLGYLKCWKDSESSFSVCVSSNVRMRWSLPTESESRSSWRSSMEEMGLFLTSSTRAAGRASSYNIHGHIIINTWEQRNSRTADPLGTWFWCKRETIWCDSFTNRAGKWRKKKKKGRITPATSVTVCMFVQNWKKK